MKDGKKKIGFVIHTEYHLMVTLTIIADFYNNANHFEIDIFQVSSSKSNRFKFPVVNNLPHLNYNIVDFEQFKFTYQPAVVNAINTILSAQYDSFVIFNQHNFLDLYLVKMLHRSQPETKLYLAPDGLKPFFASEKLTLRWSTNAAIRFYKFTKAHKLRYFPYFPSISYADIPEVEYLYMHFPEFYKNRWNKKIVKFDLFGSADSVTMLNKFFGFNIDDELPARNNVIFYLNQPLEDPRIFDFEYKLIQDLRSKFPDYKLVIKLHPLTSKAAFDKLAKIENCLVIEKSHPAEFYIANLTDSIVLSFWSAACFMDNPRVRTYWLYPALEAAGIMPRNVSTYNPTTHITDVTSVDEII